MLHQEIDERFEVRGRGDEESREDLGVRWREERVGFGGEVEKLWIGRECEREGSGIWRREGTDETRWEVEVKVDESD